MYDIIIAEYPFEFFETKFMLYRTSGNQLLVPIEHLCDVLGLNSEDEYRFIHGDEILYEGLVKTLLPKDQDKEYARNELVDCLDVKFFPYWLAVLSISRITSGSSENIIRYQNDAVKHLWMDYLFKIVPNDLGEDVDYDALNSNLFFPD